MKFFRIFLFFVASSECANILGLFPLPYFSHATFHHSYMKALADKGHNLTIFITYLGDYDNNPNVTQIHLPKSVEIHKNHTDMLMFKRKNLSWWNIMFNFELKSYLKAIEYEMELPEMQDLIHNHV